MLGREGHQAKAMWGPVGVGRAGVTDLFSISLYLPPEYLLSVFQYVAQIPMALWHNRELKVVIQSQRPESESVTLD